MMSIANIFEELYYYLQFPFVKYALIVCVFISLCASLLGVTLVLKRLSYIGDGLSHVGFGAMAIASIVGLTEDMYIVLPVTIIAAVLLLNASNNVKIKGDAMIAMVSVGALAVGYMLFNIFPSSNVAGDVCSTLFGSASILSITKGEVLFCVILSVIVLIYYFFMYNRIFAVTFDENFARATGQKVRLLNLANAIIIAIIIVLAMQLVGSLLISALVVFPALSSMRVFKNFKSVIIYSASISVFCSVFGALASILAETPVGPTIVVADLLCFGIFSLIGAIRRKAV